MSSFFSHGENSLFSSCHLLDHRIQCLCRRTADAGSGIQFYQGRLFQIRQGLEPEQQFLRRFFSDATHLGQFLLIGGFGMDAVHICHRKAMNFILYLGEQMKC